ncbi:MAG: hypothetical protein V4850_30500 [Myxococcota bacterium]
MMDPHPVGVTTGTDARSVGSRGLPGGRRAPGGGRVLERGQHIKMGGASVRNLEAGANNGTDE